MKPRSEMVLAAACGLSPPSHNYEVTSEGKMVVGLRCTLGAGVGVGRAEPS